MLTSACSHFVMKVCEETLVLIQISKHGRNQVKGKRGTPQTETKVRVMIMDVFELNQHIVLNQYFG